jgi:hypothetical protein
LYYKIYLQSAFYTGNKITKIYHYIYAGLEFFIGSRTFNNNASGSLKNSKKKKSGRASLAEWLRLIVAKQ